MKKLALITTLALSPLATSAQDTGPQDTGAAPDDDGASYLTTLIEDNLSGAGREVKITGFDGALSAQASLDTLTVADAEGVWLTLENVVLNWQRTALLRGSIDIQDLTAERIIVARSPITEDSQPATPSAEATPFSLPDLPVSIQIDTLDITRIELGPGFLGEPFAASLAGSANLSGGEGSAAITAQRLDGKQGLFAVNAAFENETSVLGLDLDLTEGADGVVAKLLGLPGGPALNLTVTGTGSLDDYGVDIGLATDGIDRITGRLTLNRGDGGQQFDLEMGGDVSSLLLPAYQGFFGDAMTLRAQGQQFADGRIAVPEVVLNGQNIQLAGDAMIGSEGWPERFSLNGQIADATGDIVLLPLSGPKTFVDRAAVAINYDAAVSDDWTARLNVTGFDRPGLLIGDITVTGGGILQSGEGAAIGQFTNDLRYVASGLEVDNAGASRALGDQISGVIQLQRTEGTPTDLTRLTLDGPGMEVRGNARIAGGDDRLRTAARIDLTVRALDRFATLAGRDLSGDGQLAITAEVLPLDGMFDVLVAGETNNLAVGLAQLDPLMDGRGTIALSAVRDTNGTRLRTLDIQTEQAAITASADLTSTASNARLDASLSDIGLIVPALQGPVTLTARADRAAAQFTIFDVSASGPSARIAAQGTARPATAGQTIRGYVSADIADLSTFSTLLGRDLDGAINAAITGHVQTDGTAFDLDIDARTTDLVLDIAQVDPFMAGAGTWTARAGTTQSGALRADDVAVDTPALRLRAQGSYDAEQLPLGQIDLSLTPIGQAIANLDGPVSLRGSARRETDGGTVIDVRGTGPDTRLVVDAQIAPETQQMTGTLTAAVADLGLYRDLAGLPLGGALDLVMDGTALPDLSGFDASVDLSSTDLAIGHPSVDPLLRGRGRLQAAAVMADTGLKVEQINAVYPNITLTGALDTAQGAGGGQFDARLRDIGLIASGITGAATASGTAQQDSSGNWRVKANATAPGTTALIDATIDADTNRISGRADASVASLRPYSRLTGLPLSGGFDLSVDGFTLPDLTRADAAINLTTRDLAIGNTSVDPLLAGQGRLRADIARTAQGLRVRDFNATTPNMTLNGTLDAGAGAGRGQFDARLRDIGVFTDQLSGAVTASGTANRTANGVWTLDTSGAGPGGITVTAGGQYAQSGTLDLDIGGRVPLGLANAALAPRRLDGIATIDLSVNGPPALSSVTGQVTTADARLTAPAVGLALEDITGGVTLTGRAAQLDLTGQVNSGGSVQITGPVGLDQGNIADITVALNSVDLRDPTLYETTVDGQITLRGPLAGGARIAGRLDLGPTELQVPTSGVGALGDLPTVTHLGADAAVNRTLAYADALDSGTASQDTGAASSDGAAFPVDLTINAPSRIFIRGRGLDAELGGQLRLGGTTSNLLPSGQFNLVRGRLDILQQRFELTEGRASLRGDFVPFIRLVATTEAATGTVINIIVEGPASEPEVTFESIPQLPQDEVLAQLIFGRDLADISPLQAVQLAAAVGTLAGRGGGGLIDTFRQDIGLDDFDVTTDEEGNAAVRAGAYVSENVYTDVTVSSDGSTEVNINLDVTKNLTAKGTVSDDGETSIGLFFERDY